MTWRLRTEEEPGEGIGLEGLRVRDDLDVHAKDGAMTDQGGAGWTREPRGGGMTAFLVKPRVGAAGESTGQGDLNSPWEPLA